MPRMEEGKDDCPYTSFPNFPEKLWLIQWLGALNLCANAFLSRLPLLQRMENQNSQFAESSTAMAAGAPHGIWVLLILYPWVGTESQGEKTMSVCLGTEFSGEQEKGCEHLCCWPGSRQNWPSLGASAVGGVFWLTCFQVVADALEPMTVALASCRRRWPLNSTTAWWWKRRQLPWWPNSTVAFWVQLKSFQPSPMI